jgi:hypothetical protein
VDGHSVTLKLDGVLWCSGGLLVVGTTIVPIGVWPEGPTENLSVAVKFSSIIEVPVPPQSVIALASIQLQEVCLAGSAGKWRSRDGRDDTSAMWRGPAPPGRGFAPIIPDGVYSCNALLTFRRKGARSVEQATIVNRFDTPTRVRCFRCHPDGGAHTLARFSIESKSGSEPQHLSSRRGFCTSDDGRSATTIEALQPRRHPAHRDMQLQTGIRECMSLLRSIFGPELGDGKQPDCPRRTLLRIATTSNANDKG